MTLAACAKDIKFYKYPSLQLCAVYESQDNVNFKNVSWCNEGEKLLVTKAKGCPVVLQRPRKVTEEFLEPLMEIDRGGVIVGTFSNTTNNVVALGTCTGDVCLYDISRKISLCHYDELPGSVNNIEFLCGDKCLAVGLVTGEIFLFNGHKKPAACFMVPNSISLSSMACHKFEANLLAAGSKEGVSCVWDTETSNLLNLGKNHANLVSDVTFNGNTFTTVSIDGRIVTYDLRRNSFVTSNNLKAALSSVSYIPNTYEVVISTCEGQIRSYDTRYFTTPIHTVMYNSWIKQIRYPQSSCENIPEANPQIGKEVPELDNPQQLKEPNLEIQDLTKNVSVTPLELQELTTALEDKIKQTKNQFEEKMLQTFYALRIDASKQFIGLDERISQTWLHFVDYIQSTTESNPPNARSVERGSIRSVCATEMLRSQSNNEE